MSVDFEEEEKQEDKKKSEMYKEIFESKIFLKAYNRNKFEFDLRFPKASFDKIIQLYGKERILPMSFVLFSNPFEVTESIRYSSRNINVRTSVQINSILDVLNNYYIYPASYENLDELEKISRAPKLKPAYLKNIAKKMGIAFSEMINYISLEMTEIDVRETVKTVVSVQMYQIVFNLIHLLNVKFPDKESFEFAFYSYRKMLKMAGIELEKIIPYLEILILKNNTREELLNLEKSIIYDKVIIRELKESINPKIINRNIDLYAGIKSCERLPKPDPIILEPFREEASNLLLRLTGNDEKNEEQIEEIDRQEINVIEKDNEEPEIERQESEKENEENNPENENENEEENREEVEIKIEDENKDKIEPEQIQEENKDKMEPERMQEENTGEVEIKLEEENENKGETEQIKEADKDEEQPEQIQEENREELEIKIEEENKPEPEQITEANKDEEQPERMQEENKEELEIKLEEENKPEPEQITEANKDKDQSEPIREENKEELEIKIEEENKDKDKLEQIQEENKDKVQTEDKNNNIKPIENNVAKEENKIGENTEENLNNQSIKAISEPNKINLDENKKENEEPNTIKNIGENIDKNKNINIKLYNNTNFDNKELEKQNEKEISKSNPEDENIIRVENITLLKNEQNNDSIINDNIKNPENIEKNKLQIADYKSKDKEDNKQPENKDIDRQILISGGSNEPNKENEDLNKNKIIGQAISFGEGSNEDNKNKEIILDNNALDNNKEELVKNNEQIKNDLNIINSKKVLRAKKDTNKNKGKDENKNKIEGQMIVAGNTQNDLVKDKKIINSQMFAKDEPNKKNDNNINGQIIGTDNNDKNINNNDLTKKNNINNDNINKMNNISIGKKKPKRQFKIRRAVFVKVEK